MDPMGNRKWTLNKDVFGSCRKIPASFLLIQGEMKPSNPSKNKNVLEKNLKKTGNYSPEN